MLKVRHLNKSYKTTAALSDVSFELKEGIYGFLGPNGAGKSTLIHLITDNIRRDSGEILWNEKDIRVLDKEYRDILGYMPQYQGYYKGFTAKAGKAKITLKKPGKAHPYHLIHTDSNSNVYGWVDEGSFD